MTENKNNRKRNHFFSSFGWLYRFTSLSPFSFLLFLFSFLLLLTSCTSSKNTAGTRWYHSINTRYNVYFNGDQAYQQAMKAQEEEYVNKENFSGMILMFPVSSLPKDKTSMGGPFDRAIEKSVKSIKTHSIQTKPAKQSGKQSDPKYREFMSRTEYNPFLYKAWLLMAKSQFHNGDFLQAASSFSYISRLYASQPQIANEAIVWKARAYGEMDWFFEAEDLLSKINPDVLTKEQKQLFSATKADLFIKQKQYTEAVPYLKTTIESEKNKLQKMREKYLLGQLYTHLGQKEQAYRIFGEINSRHAPYILEFSAKIRQTEVYPGGDTTKVTKQLRKMTKSSKNKDYLDQIYYALGNIYLSLPDTAKAVASYEQGVKESTQNGIAKVLNQIKLGDIYFEQGKYILAQPNYSEALSQLKKGDEDYPRVSKRSAVLDELVVYYEAVELQDSLQRLSRMSEDDRLAVINKIIEDLIKKEEEERKNAEREEFLANREDNRNQSLQNPNGGGLGVAPPTDPGVFYFYNPQVVAMGKNNFQQKWGRRKLEDDWRRRNKMNPMDLYAEESSNNETENEDNPLPAENDSIISEEVEPIALSDDPKDPQFYLQQIPFTEEDIEASNLILSDGLYHMGVIYKDLLEDYGLALETFNRLDTRFPENENQLMAYYHTYLIYLRRGDMEMANLYKQKIIAAFPDSDYAIAMADPDYEYNMRMMDVMQDSLYQATYDAYLNGNIDSVRENYNRAATKYSQSKLIPQFMFLNALSYVPTKDVDTFKNQLRDLISKYPDADVSVLAAEMMKGFQRGLTLSSSGDGMLAHGSLFNIRFGAAGNGENEVDSSLVFSAETRVPHLLSIIYPKGTLNDNLLLYTIAGFNFGNFKVNDFDMEQTTVNDVMFLQIKGFQNMNEVLQYMQMIYQPEGYARDLEKTALLVPISGENYHILMKGKSLEEYMKFFEEQFGKDNQALIEKWKFKQAEEAETLAREIEEKENLLPENEKETEEEVQGTEIQNPVVQETLDQDTVCIDLPETNHPEQDSIPAPKEEEVVEEQINDVYNQASDLMDKAQSTMDELANDPIRWFLNLFKKKPSNPIDEYAKEQEKAEKERQQKLKEAQKAKEKAERKEKEDALKQKQADDKARQKQKDDERKAKQKAREEARKKKK